ncbi:MAG: hypothetical protein COA49_01875 [Bacteroidetes bacterium]|nr:MAG: hypothetical protein COA49_01875 [Bacteroidota bacterium]
MKTLPITLLGGLLCFTQLSLAQVPAFPYNPDVDSNAFIELTDLLYFLDLYGQPWSFSDDVSEPGDLLYYDVYENESGDMDSAWIRLPIGAEGQILSVYNGIPKWSYPADILLDAFPCLESICLGGEEIISGCTAPLACNYMIGSTNDDGSCTYDCYGCIDPEACNFNSTSIIDNGSCEYINEGDCDCQGSQLDALGICGGFCEEDLDNDGICDNIDQESCNPIGGYSVGDIGPGGGVIIYDNGTYIYTNYNNSSYDCWRYLEVSSEILSPQIWGCYSSSISGLTNAIGSGEINTQIILDTGCEEISEVYAALSASNYLGGGLSDWFLPSPDELMLLTSGESFDFTQYINNWEFGEYWTSDQFMNVGYLGTFINFSDEGKGGIQTIIGGTNVNVAEIAIIPMRRF